jgi:enoyl-CoA hydratase/carnithine racemase
VSLTPRSFRFEHDAASGVATITLDRPERLNALTFEVYAELRDLFAALDTAPGVRVVLLTGAGRGFCSGGDVEDIIGKLFGRSAEELLAFTTMTCDVVANMRRCRRPIVAAVNGTAAGAGAVLAAASDVRFAADSARIAFLFVKVGLSGADMGISWLLPRLVGPERALDLVLSGRVVLAEEARSLGLVNRVLPPERLLEEALEYAHVLASSCSPASMATMKRQVYADLQRDLPEALEEADRLMLESFTGDDFVEGVTSFLERRDPRFAPLGS